MKGQHHYSLQVYWTGNRGSGTSGYRDYDRDHTIRVPGKPNLQGSSDPAFRGDPSRHNPEELLLAALSACHMLWYLHLCAEAGITVISYEDHPTGTMIETADGGGHFTEVTLRPQTAFSGNWSAEQASALHHTANERCFIARSVNFPVHHAPVYIQ